MLTFLYILLGLAMFAVVVTLIMGGKAMAGRNAEDRSASNSWMWKRVWAQASAIGILLLILLVKRNGG